MSRSLVNGQQGFARSAGEARYPRLWDQLVLSMTPCLGLGGTRNQPDLSPSRFDSVLQGSAAASSMTGSPLGPALYFNGNTGIQWTAASWGLPPKVYAPGSPTSDAYTIQVVFRYAHKAGATKMFLYRSDNPGALDTLFYGYGLWVQANTDQAYFFTNAGIVLDPDLRFQWSSPTSSLVPDKWHHLIVTKYDYDAAEIEIGQTVMMNLDGTWIYPAVPTPTEYHAVCNVGKNARCGTALNATTPDMGVALLNIWHRRLRWREIDALQVDPLMMYRRRERGGGGKTRIVSIGGAVSRRYSGLAVTG